NSDGEMVRSLDLLAKGPLAISFYRGVWCGYCNLELQAIEAARDSVEAQGATLIAISPQTQVNSRKTREEWKLGFPILADHHAEVAAPLGLRLALRAVLRSIYKAFGVALALITGEQSGPLPMPARYVIAQDGRIAYGEVSPDYTRRPDPSVLL